MFGFGGATNALATLTKNVQETYKELVTTTVQFNDVRKYTKDVIDEFKRLLERQSDKIDRIERERVKAEAELLARIAGLEAHLNALSEAALHAVAMGAATQVMEKIQREKTLPGQKPLPQHGEGNNV